MERCPTCGRDVSSVFSHVDQRCETWDGEVTHEVTWEADGKPCSFAGSESEVREIRDFMLRHSQLRRTNISAVLKF